MGRPRQQEDGRRHREQVPFAGIGLVVSAVIMHRLTDSHGHEEGLDVVGGAADEVDQTHLATAESLAKNLGKAKIIQNFHIPCNTVFVSIKYRF